MTLSLLQHASVILLVQHCSCLGDLTNVNIDTSDFTHEHVKNDNNIFSVTDTRIVKTETSQPTIAPTTIKTKLSELIESFYQSTKTPSSVSTKNQIIETHGTGKNSTEFTKSGQYQEPTCPKHTLFRQVHKLRASNEYNEVSYLAVSSQKINDENVMWLGNDGNVNEITAATITGRIIRTYKIDFPFSGDAETISLGPCSSSIIGTTICLYIGFLGNNNARGCEDRKCVDGNKEGFIFKAPEPDVTSRVDELKGVTLVIDYSKTIESPTSRADCEAIFVDFTGDKISGKPGDIYIVTKPQDKSLTRIFLFPVSGHENAANGAIVNHVTLKLVAEPKQMIWTGADMSRQGNFISGKADGTTYIWTRNTWTSTVAMALEEEYCSNFEMESNDVNDRQFEATAFLPDGNAFVEISECAGMRGCNPNIWITYFNDNL